MREHQDLACFRIGCDRGDKAVGPEFRGETRRFLHGLVEGLWIGEGGVDSHVRDHSSLGAPGKQLLLAFLLPPPPGAASNGA